MLVAGPASDVNSPWLRGERIRPGLTGTGLAIPKARPVVKTIIAGRMIVQNGSMCFSGLRVSRPARCAVWSPKRRATAPCDTSCRMIDGRRTR
jgi:hypothetical protein